MSKEETKRHFAELCECVWHRIESGEKLGAEDAERMRETVTKFAAIAWNISLVQKSLPDLKKALKKFVDDNDNGGPNAMIPLMYAAELKWGDYRNDRELIAGTEVKTVNGKPQVIVHLLDDAPRIDSPAKAFYDFMNSPEIQERLKHTSPEMLKKEVRRIVAEYNASLPVSDEIAVPLPERDFPISKDELNCAYNFMKNEVPQERKDKILTPLLQHLPFLAALCQKTSAKPIQNIIMTVASVYLPDTDLIGYRGDLYQEVLEEAGLFANAFIRDEREFCEMTADCAEPNLIVFLAKTIRDLKLSPKDFKQTLNTLIAWGLIVEAARSAKNPDKYPDFEDDVPEEEHYDFDQKNLRLFYLHAKLCGFRVSVDLIAPEDATFEQLHAVLNSVFQRDDDHLYFFECDDGFAAVRDKEAWENDDAVLADKCYLGHHLKRGSKVYYLFDYGDGWEHDITVKKVVTAEPKDCHFEVLKITGEIPEQYPDYDEEDE